MEDYGFVLLFSLLITLAMELFYALLWGARKGEFRFVLLANVLTNPVVVFLAILAEDYPQTHDVLLLVLLLLELAATAVEALIYARRTKIRFPWAFSLCANALSFTIGLLLT